MLLNFNLYTPSAKQNCAKPLENITSSQNLSKGVERCNFVSLGTAPSPGTDRVRGMCTHQLPHRRYLVNTDAVRPSSLKVQLCRESHYFLSLLLLLRRDYPFLKGLLAGLR